MPYFDPKEYKLKKTHYSHVSCCKSDRGRLLLRTPGPVPLGLAYVLLVETNPFLRTCRYFSGLCSSNIPRYFLDFALCVNIHVHSPGDGTILRSESYSVLYNYHLTLFEKTDFEVFGVLILCFYTLVIVVSFT